MAQIIDTSSLVDYDRLYDFIFAKVYINVIDVPGLSCAVVRGAGGVLQGDVSVLGVPPGKGCQGEVPKRSMVLGGSEGRVDGSSARSWVEYAWRSWERRNISLTPARWRR